PSLGYVARGKYAYSRDRLLIADNSGKLLDADGGSWLVTGLYDDGDLQRYRIEVCFGKYVGARIGLFVVGEDYYYGREDEGFVVRGTWRQSVARVYIANNEGHLAHAVQNPNGSWMWVDENGCNNRDQAIDIVLSAAWSSLGIPYVWSGESPLDGGMDCSGLVYYCYKQLGIVLSRVTYDNMVGEGTEVSFGEARPGDLIFMYYSDRGPEHVVLYVGNGMVIEEPNFNMSCQYVSLASKHASRIQIKRIIT
ncbi:MAG: C40 family peptidase, partial [Bacteroides sp.]